MKFGKVLAHFSQIFLSCTRAQDFSFFVVVFTFSHCVYTRLTVLSGVTRATAYEYAKEELLSPSRRGSQVNLSRWISSRYVCPSKVH